MNYNREQVFQYGRARHQFTHTMTTGVKKDGTIMALKHLCYLDGGAYSSFGIATVYYADSLLGGPYKLPNMKYDGYRIYNNKPACSALRGHGGVAARACWEQQLDMIAEELKISPIELRLKNMGSPKQVVVEYSIVILISYLFGLLQVFTGNPTRFGYQSSIL